MACRSRLPRSGRSRLLSRSRSDHRRPSEGRWYCSWPACSPFSTRASPSSRGRTWSRRSCSSSGSFPSRPTRFPVDLPFNLEPYRLFLLALVFAWLVGLIAGRSHLSADGQTYPLLFFTAVLFATQIVNFEEVNTGIDGAEALKSLFYFLSFVIVFLLVTSTLDSIPAIDKLVRALVVGAALVAVTAIYDSRFSYNVFDHLHQWIPVLEYHPREVDRGRAAGFSASTAPPSIRSR